MEDIKEYQDSSEENNGTVDTASMKREDGEITESEDEGDTKIYDKIGKRNDKTKNKEKIPQLDNICEEIGSACRWQRKDGKRVIITEILEGSFRNEHRSRRNSRKSDSKRSTSSFNDIESLHSRKGHDTRDSPKEDNKVIITNILEGSSRNEHRSRRNSMESDNETSTSSSNHPKSLHSTKGHDTRDSPTKSSKRSRSKSSEDVCNCHCRSDSESNITKELLENKTEMLNNLLSKLLEKIFKVAKVSSDNLEDQCSIETLQENISWKKKVCDTLTLSASDISERLAKLLKERNLDFDDIFIILQETQEMCKYKLKMEKENKDSDSKNIEDMSTQADKLKDQQDIECELNFSGECPYGPEGVACNYNHPQCCKNFLIWGTTERGCSYGTLCQDFHPKLCQSSLKLSCINDQCQFKESYHTKNCKLIRDGVQINKRPPCKICQAAGKKRIRSSKTKSKSRSRTRERETSNQIYQRRKSRSQERRRRSISKHRRSQSRSPSKERQSKTSERRHRSRSRHRKRSRSKSPKRRYKSKPRHRRQSRSLSKERKNKRSYSPLRKRSISRSRSPIASNIKSRTNNRYRSQRYRSRSPGIPEYSLLNTRPTVSVPPAIMNILETNSLTISNILENSHQSFACFPNNSEILKNSQYNYGHTEVFPHDNRTNKANISAINECPGCIENIKESSKTVTIFGLTNQTTASSIIKEIFDTLGVIINIKDVNINGIYQDITITFKHDLDALTFVNYYGYCFKSTYTNIEFQPEIYFVNNPQYSVHPATSGRHVAGMPKSMLVKTYLLASISMNIHRKASAEKGLSSIPCSISLSSNCGSVTFQIPWSDNLYLNEKSEREDFLEQIMDIFRKNLKKINDSHFYDDVVIIFETYENAWIFLEWIRPSLMYQEFLDLVSYVGVVPLEEIHQMDVALDSKYNLESIRVSIDNVTLGSCKASKYCHYRSRILRETIEILINMNMLTRFIAGCIELNIFSKRKVPPVDIRRSNLCFVAIEYINKEIGQGYELTQIGASFSSKPINKPLNKSLKFWPIMPKCAVGNKDLLHSLNLSKNVTENEYSYFHPGQKKNYNAVSEKEALKSLFSFIQEQNASDKSSNRTTLFTYSSYTTLSIFLQAVQQNGLEDEFYESFDSYCDLHLIIRTFVPHMLDSQDQFPPLQDLVKYLLDKKFPSELPPANGIATVLSAILNQVFSNEDDDYVYTKLVKKFARPTSHLMLPSIDPFNIQVKMKNTQGFKKKGAQKEVLYFETPIQKDILLRDLCLYLHPAIKSDFRVELTNITSNNVTVIFNNLTDSYKTIGHVGCLFVKPKPMEVVRQLSNFYFSAPYSKHSCVEHLELNGKKRPEDEKRQKILNEMQKLKNTLMKTSEDPEDTIVTTDAFSKATIKPKKSISTKNTDVLFFQDVSLFVLGIKSMKIHDEESLLEISLYKPDKNVMHFTTMIIPEKINRSIPHIGYSCVGCENKEALHFAKDCPLLAKCNCIASSKYAFHQAKDCTSSNCWNCGKDHNWRRCPIQVYLTYEQRKLHNMGFRFNKQKLVFINSAKELVPCLSINHALIRLRLAMKNTHKKVLIGYDIGTVINKLKHLANSIDQTKDIETLMPIGVIDIRWLFPESLQRSSLESLREIAHKIDNQIPLDRSTEVVKCISEIICERFDLSDDINRQNFCLQYMIYSVDLPLLVNYICLLKNSSVFTEPSKSNTAPISLDKSVSALDSVSTNPPKKKVIKSTLRERLIHFLALTPYAYTEKDILDHWEKNWMADKKGMKTQKMLVMDTVKSICFMRSNKYILLRHIWNEVNVQWPSYSEHECERTKKMKSDKLAWPKKLAHCKLAHCKPAHCKHIDIKEVETKGKTKPMTKGDKKVEKQITLPKLLQKIIPKEESNVCDDVTGDLMQSLPLPVPVTKKQKKLAMEGNEKKLQKEIIAAESFKLSNTSPISTISIQVELREQSQTVPENGQLKVTTNLLNTDQNESSTWNKQWESIENIDKTIENQDMPQKVLLKEEPNFEDHFTNSSKLNCPSPVSVQIQQNNNSSNPMKSNDNTLHQQMLIDENININPTMEYGIAEEIINCDLDNEFSQTITQSDANSCSSQNVTLNNPQSNLAITSQIKLEEQPQTEIENCQLKIRTDLFNTIQNSPCKLNFRDRIIHLLAVKPYTVEEIITQIKTHGIKKQKNLSGRVTSLLKSISTSQFDTEQYDLMEHIWNEVNVDWPLFTEEDRRAVIDRKPMTNNAAT